MALKSTSMAGSTFEAFSSQAAWLGDQENATH
jgi:hypothetical protein